MPEPEPLHVLDSSVAFDLINGRLILETQSLPCVFAVPDIIYEEEFNDEAKEEFSKTNLVILEFDGTQVAEVYGMKAVHNRPPMADLFAFVGAKDNQSILITGDGALRTIAEEYGLTVHGTLWILDELVTQNLLVPRRAAQALRDILIKKSRLPQDECIRRFKAWGEKSNFWEDIYEI